MEAVEVTKRRGRPPKDVGRDGQDGAASDRARVDHEAHEGWRDFSLRLVAAEKAHPHRRIVRVWHPDAPVALWHGPHSSAPVEAGDVSYQWNNGEIAA